jgi:hypothetical protein
VPVDPSPAGRPPVDAGSRASQAFDAGERLRPLDGGIYLKVRGNQSVLPYGAAVVGPKLVTVTLASRPLTCDVAMYPARIVDDPDRVTVELRVPPGPGRRFFSGHRVGVQAWLQGTRGADAYFAPRDVSLRLDEVNGWASGHLMGWADLEHTDGSARGYFDVPICNNVLDSGSVVPALPALPENAPTTPMSGMIAGVPFLLKSAVAVVSHDPKRGADTLWKIEWYASEHVDCSGVPPEPSLPCIRGSEIGGVSSLQDFTGSQQPISDVVAAPDWKAWKSGKHPAEGSGWVQLDALHFQEGETVSGSAALVFTGGAASGSFVALVCRETWK